MVATMGVMVGYIVGTLMPNSMNAGVPGPVFMALVAIVFSYLVAYIAFRGVNGSTGVNVAINLIADPDWDHERFRIVREWCLEMPDVINISVNTPYPGTESWITDGRRLETRDYRLFDIQHAVLPTRLPLAEFYRELVTTQRAIYRRHLDWRQLWDASGIAARLLLRGHTNFVKSLFSPNHVYRPELLLADHAAPVLYQIPLPPKAGEQRRGGASLYVHAPRGRKSRAIDTSTERFVEETRMGTVP